MRRIFSDYAYGPGPRAGCWWNETCDIPMGDEFNDEDVDVAIIGGGFTGFTTALTLARAGAKVALFEAQAFGWGASGRNGGFCCLGGGIASDAELDRRYGKPARLAFRKAEVAAVAHVEAEIARLAIQVDRHSVGETALAHRPKDVADLRHRIQTIVENYEVEPQFLERSDLPSSGVGGGQFHAALTVPIGFALNPRKYISGLVHGARKAGARLHDYAQVDGLKRCRTGWEMSVRGVKVHATQVVIATNGYSSETIPEWFQGRYMPAQSTVLVTRPLTEAELAAQGWETAQMCYDTRNLLHYFRLMPDRRFLFGMRGGLCSGARAEAKARGNTRRDFDKMFPVWRSVETTHSWSGFVSLARNKLPFVGPVPKMRGLWTALCFHGNGVAMGSYAGALVAQQLLGHEADACPEVMRVPLARFPLGSFRRLLMPPLYAIRMIEDRT